MTIEEENFHLKADLTRVLALNREIGRIIPILNHEQRRAKEGLSEWRSKQEAYVIEIQRLKKKVSKLKKKLKKLK